MLQHYKNKHLTENNGDLASFDESIFKEELEAIKKLPLRQLVLKYRKVYPFRTETLQKVLTVEETQVGKPKWSALVGFKTDYKETAQDFKKMYSASSAISPEN